MLSALLLLAAPRVAAQYYTWGSDQPMKWSTVRTSDVRMIYPDTAAQLAQRTLFYVRMAQPAIGYGFAYGPMRIPFVMHPGNFRSNGLVMYLPKRVEFLSSPAVESYSMPWCKQLVAHEYRHAAQYNNLDRGVIRVLSYLLGQQGSTVGLLCMPIWAMEGDAVMSETMMSSFGRGLQPSFSMGYRAMGRVGADRRGRLRRNVDKWFCGSYRDYVPDHYELGYQLCSYAWERYGENVWDKVARFGSRNPYMLATTRIALEKYYDTNVSKLFRETFDALHRFWGALPDTEDSARTLCELPDGDYTRYRWPLPLGDSLVVALRSDYAAPARFVAIDPRTGRERTVARVGDLSSRPTLDGGRLVWTEYRRSALFEQRVRSQLVELDLTARRPRPRAFGSADALYATWTAGGRLAWVEYAPDGGYAVRRGDETLCRTEPGCELHGLAWDDASQALYALVTDDGGMHIARVERGELRPVTRRAYVTLSHLRAAGGRLYFGSIASGKDEAHCLDLASGREYRLTQSRYGAFEPAPAGDSLLLTLYDARGYRVAVRPASDSVLCEVEPVALPRNLVNPPRRRWDVLNLDSVHFSPSVAARQQRAFRPRRYRKVPNLVNVHSWMPVAFNPFDAVDEHRIELNFGATLLSQNLLSNTEAFVSYGWNRAEGSLVRSAVRYFGLGVRFDFDLDYGGNQLFYALSSYDPVTGNPVYQARPAPDRYFSTGLSASLPLCFQRGYRTRWLTLAAGWNYSNGMVADVERIEWTGGSISNIQHVGFREGLHKLSFDVTFTDRTRLAHRDFAPRLGYTLAAGYTFNPANGRFSDLISLYGQLYLPGAAPHHSLRLASTYQTSVGGYQFPSGYAPLSYRSSRLIPRGFTSAEIVSNGYFAARVDYQLPLCYPEGGIGSVLYFKRIRLGLGGDYAQFRRPDGAGMDRRRIWSAGGELVFDINVFRQPASATSTVRLSMYRPSTGGVDVSVALGLPF